MTRLRDNCRIGVSRRSADFKVGDKVVHKRFGPGIIEGEWGAIPLTDEAGNPVFKMRNLIGADGEKRYSKEPVSIDCRGIFDVRFGNEHGCRSVHQCGLSVKNIITSVK